MMVRKPHGAIGIVSIKAGEVDSIQLRYGRQNRYRLPNNVYLNNGLSVTSNSADV